MSYSLNSFTYLLVPEGTGFFFFTSALPAIIRTLPLQLWDSAGTHRLSNVFRRFLTISSDQTVFVLLDSQSILGLRMEC